MDQRTRERLPVLPILISTADQRRRTAADLLQTARNTEPGAVIPGTDPALRRALAPKAAGHLTWAEETADGRRRNLTYEEEEASWAFAAIEVLSLTGVRIEELLELRGPTGAIPLVAAYDVREKVWNPPMLLLFQRGIGSEQRVFTPTALRKLLINALAAPA